VTAVEWQRHFAPPESLRNLTDHVVSSPATDGAELAAMPSSSTEEGGVGTVLSS
jgi:hypothetical protein